MSTKFLNAFVDDTGDLKRQIGCMTGIFRMFDRDYLLRSRRSGAGYSKRLLSDHACVKKSSPSAKHREGSRQYILEKHSSKNNFSDNQRASVESSRTSFSSSSCSSSFSSVECSKSIQEPASLDRAIFPDRIYDPLRHQPLDLREVVKDLINKEARGLVVKMSSMEQLQNNALKQRDPPRSVKMSKSADGTCVLRLSEKTKLGLEANESLRVLAKLKDAPWNFSEPGERPRSSYEGNYSAAKDTPRFSCDGRESSRLCFNSRDNVRTVSKLGEPPRFSLDSRQGSTRICNLDLKLNSVLNDSERSEISKSSTSSSARAQQEFRGHKSHSSVVTKLMGLEVMPTFSSVNERAGDESANYEKKDNDHQNGQKDIAEILSKSSQVGKQNHQTMKSITHAKDPIEIAPWRQKDELGIAKKAVFGHREPRMKNHLESVFSEIEEGLKDLDFGQSNKDLRALKQIIDSIKEKGILEAKNSDHPSSFQFRKSYRCQLADGNIRSLKSRKESSLNLPLTLSKGRSLPRDFESPIVIMKPAKSVTKSDSAASAIIPLNHLSGLHKLRTGDFVERRKPYIPDTMTKDVKPSKKGEENCSQRPSSRTIQSSCRHQQSIRDSTTVRTSNSLSPRLHQRKHKLEKTLQPSVPSSPETSRSPRQSTKKLSSDSLSPRVKTRRNASHAEQNDEQSGQACGEIRSFAQPSNELTSAQKSPSGRSANYAAITLKQKKSSRTAKEEAMENPTSTTSQPSPVSVLDASFYHDDLPTSPITKISATKDVNVAALLEDKPSENLRTEINHAKLESIEIVVPNLPKLSSNDEKTKNTDHIAFLCETHDPDHRYVSEILLASGLLMKDLASSRTGPINIRLHPSGHPINPDLFLVLEQTKSGSLYEVEHVHENILRNKYDPEKLQRKLVFDLVNEVLSKKLELATTRSLPNLHLRPWRSSRSFPRGQRLLRELCSEIDQIQERIKASSSVEDYSIPNPDSLCKSERWEDFKGDISGVVLDLERLIFKDLVCDIVSGEAASFSRTKPRRKLFIS